MFSYVWQVTNLLYRRNICKADCFPWVIVRNTCAGYTLQKTDMTSTRRCTQKNLHALKCTCASSSISLSHFHTHTHTCTYTWRAAHLANRPHYTGGWSIDPSVEELKKSPFSSLPSRMCDMMSWSYLPALCSMTANLTCSRITLHMMTKNVCNTVGRVTLSKPFSE